MLDWSWLGKRLRAVGTVGLSAAYGEHSSGDTMRLVADAIRMSLHALQEDPGQLAGQLFGRLGNVPGSELPAILIEALAEAQGSFILPRRASLAHPGPLRQTFHACDGVNGALNLTLGWSRSATWF